MIDDKDKVNRELEHIKREISHLKVIVSLETPWERGLSAD